MKEEALKETKGYYYIASWLDSQGEYRDPFLVRAPDLVSKRYRSYNNRELSLMQRSKYRRPVNEILGEIRR